MRSFSDAIQHVGGQLSLRLTHDVQESPVNPFPEPEQAKSTPAGLGEGIDTRFTFKDWYAAQFNEFAVGMSHRVVEDVSAYPLFLVYGPTGVGKSRLLNIIGTELMKRGRKVLLIPARVFLDECVSSLRKHEGQKYNRMTEFRERYRYMWDDLLIDGLEDLETTTARHPEKTQLELELTVRALLQPSGLHRVIFTSTKPAIGRDDAGPDFLSFPERLGGVLVGAMQVPLRTPRQEELAEFARWFATKRHHVELPQGVAEFLARHAQGNLRTSEGFVNKVVAYSRLSSAHGAMSVLLAEEALGQDLGKEARSALPKNIVEHVARRYALSPGLPVTLRKNKSKLPLHVACYLCRELVRQYGKPASFPLIAEVFGMHHSTVMYAVGRVEDILAKDEGERTGQEQLAMKIVAEVKKALS